MQRKHASLKLLLLSATLLAGAHAARADDGGLDNTGQTPLPTGQLITPTFATGSSFTTLNPDLPEYTAAVGNHPFFHPNGAIASTLSPDGKTLAVMTSGFNVLDDTNAKLLGTGAEFVILYDVSNPSAPVQKQTLRPLNTGGASYPTVRTGTMMRRHIEAATAPTAAPPRLSYSVSHACSMRRGRCGSRTRPRWRW